MPPGRSRVVDDARSETSFTNSKDRSNTTLAAGKSKKAHALAVNGSSHLSKPAHTIDGPTAGLKISTGAAEAHHEPPHVDWSTLSVQDLHSYRSAYRLQIPPSYTQPHADLLYKSCDLALRAPSQCLARRKAHDLDQYRKKQARGSSGRAEVNGISKKSKGGRTKERDGKKKRDRDVDEEDSSRPTMDADELPSPTSHPSQHDSASLSNTAENASAAADPTADPSLNADKVPLTLHQADPSATVVGVLPSSNLATSIRTHFNAQQVNEAETIARFTYVVRQQGSSSTPRMQSLVQRAGPGPLPTTTAEKIAITADNARVAALNAAGSTSLLPLVSVATSGATAGPSGADKGKTNAHSSHTLSTSRSLGGNHIEVEGSYGDGSGWVMGTTSCGRQVRVVDGGGTGTFRLRFRP